ncbi:hypothetical protein HDN1F_24910 [gamma proteobacterium HdN1]|nr:hypothetical protein HDN1F_24910 [gamma proteobacterium HdN1]
MKTAQRIASVVVLTLGAAGLANAGFLDKVREDATTAAVGTAVTSGDVKQAAQDGKDAAVSSAQQAVQGAVQNATGAAANAANDATEAATGANQAATDATQAASEKVNNKLGKLLGQ